jgi:hypothetical protein
MLRVLDLYWVYIVVIADWDHTEKGVRNDSFSTSG